MLKDRTQEPAQQQGREGKGQESDTVEGNGMFNNTSPACHACHLLTPGGTGESLPHIQPAHNTPWEREEVSLNGREGKGKGGKRWKGKMQSSACRQGARRAGTILHPVPPASY